MSKVPAGYVGHPRDITKHEKVADPTIIIVGPHCTARVFLRTDGVYAITEDLGADAGALRYVTWDTKRTESEAQKVAQQLADGVLT